MLAFLACTPVVAQMTATGHATVRIGQVSELHVDAYGGTRSLASTQPSGLESQVLRVHVRANHRWKVVLAAGHDAAVPVWVYTVDSSGATHQYRVEAGAEVVVADGSAGERVVEMELRWEASAYIGAGPPPITYTLASSEG